MIRGLPASVVASVPARGLDPWRRPKGSWALGTRMKMDCGYDFSIVARMLKVGHYLTKTVSRVSFFTGQQQGEVMVLGTSL